MKKMKKYTFTFDFTCEREPTYEEKMEISSKGLNALHDIVYEVIGEAAHHNMDFGFYKNEKGG